MFAPGRPPPTGRRATAARPSWSFARRATSASSWRRSAETTPADASLPLQPPPPAITTPPSSSSSRTTPPHTIRPTTEDDWWAVSAVHVEAFFPGAGLFTPLLRLDRVMGLQTGYANAVGSETEPPIRGPFLCLVATAAEGGGDEAEADGGGGEPSTTTPRRIYPRPSWPASLLPPVAWGAFGEASTTAGPVLGTVVVDVQGGHVPPRLVRGKGVSRLVPRAGLAYVSNLAVSPRARRAGLGTALLAAAEAQAWAWGCHALALHVDARNDGAADLYRRAGFKPATRGKPAVKGSSGLGGLSGPSGQPLALMMKVRPRGVAKGG